MSQPPHKVFTYSLRVIYAHTDQMQVVYYARYFEFIEAARNELLRDCGFTYKALRINRLDVASRLGSLGLSCAGSIR
jgi:acyl-CoA thioesterase FadM